MYLEDEKDAPCLHIWRPYWVGNILTHWMCDNCDEYREEPDDD